MAISFALNPAAGLTANRVPYAVAGGRLGDSGITFDPAANGNITYTPNGTGVHRFFGQGARVAQSLAIRPGADLDSNFRGVLVTPVALGDSTINGHSTGGNALSLCGVSTASGDARSRVSLNADGIVIFASSASGAATEKTRMDSGGLWLFGTTSNSSNGRLQLVSHSALTGGVAFGTAADGTETIWREAAGGLKTGAAFNVGSLKVNGVTRISTTQPDYTGDHTLVTRNAVTLATLDDVKNFCRTLAQDLVDVGIFQ